MRSVLSFFVLILFAVACNHEKDTLFPKPTNTIIKYDMEDGSTKDLKKAWLKKIHQAKEGVDWKSIENKNMLDKYNSKQNITKSGDKEIIVAGKLEGEWRERGSDNQAGNVLATSYNKYTDELYTVSASGIIWKGDSKGNNWQPQNEFLRFDNRFLASYFSDTSSRIISSIRGLPYYSDDKGATWTRSNGIPDDSRVGIRTWVKTEESEKLFVLSKKGNWDNFVLYLSLDQGQNFEALSTFQTSNLNNIAICNPRNTDDLYIIEQIRDNTSRILKWQDSLSNIQIVNPSSPLAFGESGRANLIGTATDSIPLLYTYDENNGFYVTKDQGKKWELLSNLPSRPWEVGVFISKTNPLNMIYGEVNSYRSLDGGLSWHLINEWYEYYNDPIRKLHADIMYIEEYETIDSLPFILISNHGGINRTDDMSFNNYNISTKGLNVAQYYSVATFPFDHDYIFAGSQDQGFQRGVIDSDSEETNPLEQVISGDYGHIVFTNGGLGMWMVYPGGWVSYYDSPLWGQISADYTLDSEDESVWIPPIVPSPIPGENAVYMAGGNINGGSGSYLIKLSHDPIDGITASQFDHNFLSNGDKVAGIAFNHFDPNIIYLSGENGSFFISNDAGDTFEKIWISVPGAHYLYGNCIYPSKIDPDVIYLTGSGYSNAPVLKSNDGGLTFNAMNNGLPSTLVFSLVANEDESLLFAASEAGPYAYVTDEGKWYDLSGTSAPSNTFWSVEYLNDSNIVRYGTYGRGVWDFLIDEQVVSKINENIPLDVNLSPNPATNFINISNVKSNQLIGLVSSDGKKHQLSFNSPSQLDLSGLNTGIYHLIIRSANKSRTVSFVKL